MRSPCRRFDAAAASFNASRAQVSASGPALARSQGPRPSPKSFVFVSSAHNASVLFEIAAAWAAPSFLRCSNLLRSWARARCRVSNASMASFKVCVSACAARAEASLASFTGGCAAAASAATTSGGMNRIRAIVFGCPGPFWACGSLRRLFASALQPLARRSRAFRRLAVASLPETSLEFIARLARAWLL